MIDSPRPSAAGVGFGWPEVSPQPLADGLPSRESVAQLGDVDADVPRIAMIVRREDPCQALVAGLDLGANDAPYLVGPIGRDLRSVGIRVCQWMGNVTPRLCQRRIARSMPQAIDHRAGPDCIVDCRTVRWTRWSLAGLAPAWRSGHCTPFGFFDVPQNDSRGHYRNPCRGGSSTLASAIA